MVQIADFQVVWHRLLVLKLVSGEARAKLPGHFAFGPILANEKSKCPQNKPYRPVLQVLGATARSSLRKTRVRLKTHG